MSPTIRISDEAVEGLNRIQRPRETRSEEILRLLGVFEAMNRLSEVTRTKPEYQEWKKRKEAG